jgi:hypothetical protein
LPLRLPKALGLANSVERRLWLEEQRDRLNPSSNAQASVLPAPTAEQICVKVRAI